jgi:hypothetical protein
MVIKQEDGDEKGDAASGRMDAFVLPVGCSDGGSPSGANAPSTNTGNGSNTGSDTTAFAFTGR